MVCHAYTHLEPNELLILLKGIEAKIGRAPGGHLAPRLIDIDILFYDNIIMHSSNLTIPHPGIVQRAFVLVPLAEIAPELEHPENHSKIKDLLGALKKGVQGVSNSQKTALITIMILGAIRESEPNVSIND